MAKQNRQAVQDRAASKKEQDGRIIKAKFAEERKVRPLTAKTQHQKDALKAFTEKQCIGLLGSSGVGKSELMCWWACKQWLEGNIDNIVITRPYQHLGNDYGATKGNDAEKLLPFCMSMLRKLKKYLGVGIMRNNFRIDTFDEIFSDVSGITIVPVEKIQGLSFDNRTIVLADEVQGMTPAQMKALTTRMEEGCQIIMSGDETQTPLRGKNGLTFFREVVEQHPHELIELIKFNPDDNCREGVTSHLTRVYETMGTW